jgi:hypothetical protein
MSCFMRVVKYRYFLQWSASLEPCINLTLKFLETNRLKTATNTYLKRRPRHSVIETHAFDRLSVYSSERRRKFEGTLPRL